MKDLGRKGAHGPEWAQAQAEQGFAQGLTPRGDSECYWSFQEIATSMVGDASVWLSGCGQEIDLPDTPDSCGFSYCPYCGKRLEYAS